MANLLATPNEILDEMTVYLDPLATFRLLITCRAFRVPLAPAMFHHASSPKQGVHALHWAADRGHLSLLQQILPLFAVDLLGTNDMTALLHSARAGNNLLLLEHLLVHGANANHVDTLGRTAFSYVCEAATNNWVVGRQVLRALISHGADVKCVNNDGDTLLTDALSSRPAEVAAYLAGRSHRRGSLRARTNSSRGTAPVYSGDQDFTCQGLPGGSCRQTRPWAALTSGGMLMSCGFCSLALKLARPRSWKKSCMRRVAFQCWC